MLHLARVCLKLNDSHKLPLLATHQLSANLHPHYECAQVKLAIARFVVATLSSQANCNSSPANSARRMEIFRLDLPYEDAGQLLNEIAEQQKRQNNNTTVGQLNNNNSNGSFFLQKT